MGYQFSTRSYRKMDGVHSELIAIASRALAVSEVDFGISEGLRTKERQRRLVNSGASKTMNSYHITGHAIDVAAYVDGELRWDWPLYDTIAEAMRQGALELGIQLTWGGAWGFPITTMDSAEAAKEAYLAKKRAQGRKPFLDGPHYQIVR